MRRVCALALLVVGGLGIAGVGLAVGFARRAQSEPRVLPASAAPVGEVTPVEPPPPAPPAPEPRPEDRPSRAAAAPRPTPTPPSAPRGPLASTVTIRSLTASGSTSGTGIVLDTAGHILTNSHVLDGSGGVRVQVGGAGPAYAAAIVGRYVEDDIAVLQVMGAPPLQPAVVGRSSTVAVGQPVAVIGNA